MSVATKVAIQVVAKLGGQNWKMNVRTQHEFAEFRFGKSQFSLKLTGDRHGKRIDPDRFRVAHALGHKQRERAPLEITMWTMGGG